MLEVGAQELEHGQQRHGFAVCLAGDLVDRHALRPPALCELVAEAALSDARLAHDADHLTLAGECLLQGALERMQLLGAPDEAREAARAGDVEPPARRADAGQLVDPQRPTGALDLELAQIGQREVALYERRRVLAEVHPVGGGELLHALREADGMADRGVLHAEVLADRPHDHLA